MVKTGRPKRKEGYKRVTFYLPDGDMPYLKRVAATGEMSASEYLHAMIDTDRLNRELNDFDFDAKKKGKE
jgi:hypothetical protein